jgi:ankyrin repeat protein
MNDARLRDELVLAIREGDCLAAKSLFDAGASADLPDEFGVPLVFQAVSLGKSRIVSLFQSAGADMNVRDFSGKTPLELAEFYDNAFVIKIINEGQAAHAKDDKD